MISKDVLDQRPTSHTSTLCDKEHPEKPSSTGPTRRGSLTGNSTGSMLHVRPQRTPNEPLGRTIPRQFRKRVLITHSVRPACNILALILWPFSRCHLSRGLHDVSDIANHSVSTKSLRTTFAFLSSNDTPHVCFGDESQSECLFS